MPIISLWLLSRRPKRWICFLLTMLLYRKDFIMNLECNRLKRIFYFLTIAGMVIAFIPAFSKLFSYFMCTVQSILSNKSLCFSLKDFIDYLISGVFLFSLVLCSSPILTLFFISLKKKKSYEEQFAKLAELIGGAVGYLIIISFFHFEFWFLAKGKPGYSTAPLVYFFLPIVSSIIIPIGCAIGGKIGDKNKRKRRK